VTAPVDDVARSEALLTAVGSRSSPSPSHRGAWDLLAVSPRGLTLIAARSETPNVMGTTYGALPGFPPSTVRLILVWGADALPDGDSRSLSPAMPAPPPGPSSRSEGARTAPPPSLVGSRCPVVPGTDTSWPADCVLRPLPGPPLAVGQSAAADARDREIRALLKAALSKLGGVQ